MTPPPTSIAVALGDWLKTFVLLAALAALAALVGHLLFGQVGLVVGTGVVAVVTLAGIRVPPTWLMRSQGAVPIPVSAQPLLYEMVGKLCRRADIGLPQLFLLPGSLPNAFSAGRANRDSVLGVTVGALDSLKFAELEGVLAHEIAHLHNHDTTILRIGSIASRTVLALVKAALWAALVMLLMGDAAPEQVTILLLLAVTAPIIVSLLEATLSRTREFAADSTAAELTGNPEALATALARVHSYERRGWALLWRPDKRPKSMHSHPTTTARIARLRRRA